MLERTRSRSRLAQSLPDHTFGYRVCVSGHARALTVTDSQRTERRDWGTRLPGVWTQAKRDRFLARRRDAVSAQPPKADTPVVDDKQPESAQADAGGTLAHLADEIAALEQRLATEGACAPDVRDLIARMREHVMDLHRRGAGRPRGRNR